MKRRRVEPVEHDGPVAEVEDKSNKVEEFKKSKIAQDIQKAFPDAKLIDLKEEE